MKYDRDEAKRLAAFLALLALGMGIGLFMGC